MRKLASIQRIWKIEPIECADRIELAHVLGWQCVVNKGQFQEMDLAVYFEVDSFLPIAPEFEFLRMSSYRKTDIMGEGFRLRTMKFRGQISQGLLLPVSTFPAIPTDAELGMDVTELLGVKKWEIEERITTGGTMIGTLPYDIPHTDETRVQAEPDLIQAFTGLEYYISTKMDGSSHSVGLDENWGASFRVDSQCLEAWRKKLLLTNPSIRTILLSATFENKCVDVLKKLFSDGIKWIEVRCDALRHEPRYILLKEKGYKKKDKKTVELVRKLPHPMIIYVAKPDDAERIKGLLAKNGINNVCTYTGLQQSGP